MSESLVATLDRVLDALAAASVPYALCGGLAVNVHGHVRALKRLAGRAQDLADLEALGLEEGDGG